MTGYRHLGLTALIALVAFALDQGSKAWVVAAYDLEPGVLVPVLPVLNFTYALNTGVNFSLGASDSATQQYALAALAGAVSLGLTVWAVRARRRALTIGAGLVSGGALANALDRLRLGGVVDFINLDCCGIGNPFAFNLADAAIFAGAFVIAFYGWSADARDDAARAADPGA